MKSVVVRHAEPGDAEALQKMYAHPALYRDTLQLPHPSLKAWHDRITDPDRGADIWWHASTMRLWGS
ncbi:putative acetyltransferase YhhY [Cedecea neteri]|uniref:Putative acetyltransferase YhhY n=1 Tax=Cedecea neteri TaxID=158822 RepID=A0A2X2VAG0_9ENTR|nr:putative acetyltransferase YhhY [Cedecea neteri]